MNQEADIISSWEANAGAWTKTITEQGIESRRLVTDQAMVNAIIAKQPKQLLDLGCGEGWLIRKLVSSHPTCKYFGLDAIPELVATASAGTPTATISVARYQDIIKGYGSDLFDRRFDIISINFALFGKELVEDLLTTIANWLTKGGLLIIQTLHPVTANGGQIYSDGWRTGSWAGFSTDFTKPAPWYFRTFEGWVKLFNQTGFQLAELQEPIHPVTGQPQSALFILCPVQQPSVSPTADSSP